VSALLFLAVALVVSVIGSIVVLVHNRSPRSVEHGVDDFAARMRALQPDENEPTEQPREQR
jgi:hypothetical protein